MFNKKLQIFGAALAVTASVFLFSGCTININTPIPQASSAPAFSNSDLMFAQMMIPHHQQAVDMGDLATTRAENEAVAKLAAEIRSEQAPEIEQMQGWLDAAGISGGMMGGMDHSGHGGMQGMLSAEELDALAALSGRDFDLMYLQKMIEHHEGAIAMAQMVIDSSNAEASALGKAIVKSQTEQIAYMKTLLAEIS